MDSVLTMIINRVSETTDIIRDRLPDASVFFECQNNDTHQNPGKSEFYIIAHQHRRAARIGMIPSDDEIAISLEIYSYRRHLADLIDEDETPILESYENFASLGLASAALIEAMNSR